MTERSNEFERGPEEKPIEETPKQIELPILATSLEGKSIEELKALRLELGNSYLPGITLEQTNQLTEKWEEVDQLINTSTAAEEAAVSSNFAEELPAEKIPAKPEAVENSEVPKEKQKTINWKEENKEIKKYVESLVNVTISENESGELPELIADLKTQLRWPQLKNEPELKAKLLSQLEKAERILRESKSEQETSLNESEPEQINTTDENIRVEDMPEEAGLTPSVLASMAKIDSMQEIESGEKKEISPEAPKVEIVAEDAEKIEAEIKARTDIENSPEAKEVMEEIKKMPEEERQKIAIGLKNIGFVSDEKKNAFFANTFNFFAKTNMDQKSGSTRFLKSLAETFEVDRDKARKNIEEIESGKTKNIVNSVKLFGNIVKYGRVITDATGLSLVSPLRYVMAGGMAFSRSSRALKESHLKNEEVIDKTREKDVELAAEEAWKIFTKAQEKAGSENISTEQLKKAYLEEMPGELLNRLSGSNDIYSKKKMSEIDEIELNTSLSTKEKWEKKDEVDNKYKSLIEKEEIKYKEASDAQVSQGMASSFIRNVLNIEIKNDINSLNKKLERVNSDNSLSEKEKEEKRSSVFRKYESRLKDYDRVIRQDSTIDTLAMAGRYAEFAGKTVVAAVSIETLALSLDHVIGSVSEIFKGREIDMPDMEGTKSLLGKLAFWKHDNIPDSISAPDSAQAPDSVSKAVMENLFGKQDTAHVGGIVHADSSDTIDSLEGGNIEASHADSNIFKDVTGGSSTSAQASVFSDVTQGHSSTAETIDFKDVEGGSSSTATSINNAPEIASASAEDNAAAKYAIEQSERLQNMAEGTHTAVIHQGESTLKVAEDMVRKGEITQAEFDKAWPSVAKYALVHEGNEVTFIPGTDGEAPRFEIHEGTGGKFGTGRDLYNRYQELGKKPPEWLETAINGKGEMPKIPDVDLRVSDAVLEQISDSTGVEIGHTHDDFIYQKMNEYMAHSPLHEMGDGSGSVTEDYMKVDLVHEKFDDLTLSTQKTILESLNETRNRLDLLDRTGDLSDSDSTILSETKSMISDMEDKFGRHEQLLKDKLSDLGFKKPADYEILMNNNPMTVKAFTENLAKNPVPSLNKFATWISGMKPTKFEQGLKLSDFIRGHFR